MPSACPRKHAGWFILLLVVLTLIVRSKRCRFSLRWICSLWGDSPRLCTSSFLAKTFDQWSGHLSVAARI